MIILIFRYVRRIVVSNLTYSVYWSIPTLFLYLTIIFLSYSVDAGKYRFIISNRLNPKNYDVRFFIIAAILIFFKSFGITGRDIVNGYYVNFSEATSIDSYPDQSVEIGFIILNVIVKNVFNSYEMLLIIIGVITVAPVLYIIKKYSDKIGVGLALLLYTSIYYFSGFSATRQYTALSICLLVFDAIYEKKYTKSIGLLLLASSFHFSSILMIVPYFIILSNYLGKRFVRRFVIIFFLLVFLAIYTFRDSLGVVLIGRYSIYSIAEEINIGFRCFVYYIPIIFFIFYVIKKQKIHDNRFDMLAIIMISLGFFLGMMEYIVSIFGRLEAITLPFVIIIPYYIKQFAVTKRKKRVCNFFVFFYCLSRFIIFIVDNYNQQDLMPYRNILGFTI